jgi:hypothetical protein
MRRNTMLKTLRLTMALGGALLAGAIAASPSAHAETATRTWVGPNGGSVHWRGDHVPGHYRGAVTVTTPDGRVYRRVTHAGRGPYGGGYYTRRWVGPNGVYRRGWARW